MPSVITKASMRVAALPAAALPMRATRLNPFSWSARSQAAARARAAGPGCRPAAGYAPPQAARDGAGDPEAERHGGGRLHALDDGRGEGRDLAEDQRQAVRRPAAGGSPDDRLGRMGPGRPVQL